MAQAKRVHIDLDVPDALLTQISDVLNDVDAVQREFDGTFTVYADDGRDADTNKETRAQKAVVARDLLRAAQMAELLAAELNVRYAQMKGNDDPRRVRR